MRINGKKRQSSPAASPVHQAGPRGAGVEALEGRLLYSAGGLDASFGVGGLATAQSTLSYINAAHEAVQSDGKIVVVGRSDDSFAVARFNADGSLDHSFGASQSGIVLTQAGGAGNSSQATSVAVQPDGRIVVVGTDGNQSAFDVVRYLPNGTLDNTFGGTGIVRTDLGDYAGYFQNVPSESASDVVLQKDGKIVVAGSAFTTGFVTASNEDFAVVRYNSNGSVDGSFGSNSGVEFVGFGGYEYGAAVAIDYNGTASTNPRYGTIVVAGNQDITFGDSQFAVARLKSNGTPDGGFSGDGKVTASLSTTTSVTAHAVVIQPGGYVVVAGGVSNLNGTGTADFALAQFRPDGLLAPAFGTSSTGWQRTDFGNNDVANAITTGADGDLLVGGGSAGNLAVAAYTPGGKLDPLFGNGGKVTTFDGEGSSVTGLATAPDGKLVAVGSGSVFHVARYIEFTPTVNVGTFNPNAYESGTKSASFLVTRSTDVGVATRVRLSLSGTARIKSYPVFQAAVAKTVVQGPPVLSVGDYTLSGISADANGYYVDIPANQTYVTVTVTPIDEKITGGAVKTAIFTVQPDPTYELGTVPGVTIDINENDLAPIVTRFPVQPPQASR